jgi:hypothetical protein
LLGEAFTFLFPGLPVPGRDHLATGFTGDVLRHRVTDHRGPLRLPIIAG